MRDHADGPGVGPGYPRLRVKVVSLLTRKCYRGGVIEQRAQSGATLLLTEHNLLNKKSFRVKTFLKVRIRFPTLFTTASVSETVGSWNT